MTDGTMSNDYEQGWAAGFFEGEGCISIRGTAGRLTLVQRATEKRRRSTC